MPFDFDLLEVLDSSERSVTRRARRLADGRQVLLQTSAGTASSDQERAFLEHELGQRRRLEAPGLPRLLDADLSGERAWLSFEDQGHVPLRARLDAGRPSVPSVLKLGILVCEVLDLLHRKNIVHHALSPHSIWIDESSTSVCLFHFHFATHSAASAEPWISPLTAKEFLPYFSPEQTGRMNRGLDYRTDFYSLGMTLYEALSGSRPPSGHDVLEAIHFQIAGQLEPLELCRPELGGAIAEVIGKLTAKAPEDRYQSALGLKADLERCLRGWLDHGRATSFPLGENDVSDRFLLSPKLYGRENEVAVLLQEFDQVCHGKTRLVLVGGYSGAGKTSLIAELYRPIVRERGRFVMGKFDPVMRGAPFSALWTALGSLLRKLLGESEEQLRSLRQELTLELGTGASVLVPELPELALLLGPKPAPPELGLTETQNRFQLALRNLLRCLATAQHPLAIFLDDLQWADAPTLALFEPILTDPSIGHLLLLGAYRDNEVNDEHPLSRTLRSLEAQSTEVQRLTLAPLALPEVTELLSDTLKTDRTHAEPLARLALQKTDGNPFFLTQFLGALKDQGWIEFDYATRSFSYRLENIERAHITDNVVELMAQKIGSLRPATQSVLSLAASLGSPFALEGLELLSADRANIVPALSEALEAGLIVKVSSDSSRLSRTDGRPDLAYRFLHDRVHQSAYELVPASQRPALHLEIGQLLLTRSDPHADEHLFDVAHHLNLSGGLFETTSALRLELVRINFRAAQKAKASAAFDAAHQYLASGIERVRTEDWQGHYDLLFALHLEQAEALYMRGSFDEHDKLITHLLEKAGNDLDRARALGLRMLALENRAEYRAALGVARESLALFGVSLPTQREGQEAKLEVELSRIDAKLAGREISTLLELPVLQDESVRRVLMTLTTIWSTAYILGEAALTRWISATMVRLSLENGNAPESAYGYVTHAITVGPVRGNYARALEYGELALRLNERLDDARTRAKIHQQFQAHVALWTEPLTTSVLHAREAYRTGLEGGDFLYAAYGAATETWPALFGSRDLSRFVSDYTPSVAIIKKLRAHSFADSVQLLLSLAEALLGRTLGHLELSRGDFSEVEYARRYETTPFFLGMYRMARLMLAYFSEDFAEAVKEARILVQLGPHLRGTIWPVMIEFYSGLAYAAWIRSGSPTAPSDPDKAPGDPNKPPGLGALAEALAALEESHRTLAPLAEVGPETYRAPALLIRAELEGLRGDRERALALLESAVEAGREARMPHYQGLALELIGQSLAAKGENASARLISARARDAYRAYGLELKARGVERRFPELRERAVEPTFDGTQLGRTRGPADLASAFDLASVIKATQALAAEIDAPRLISKLIQIALETASAERISLILDRDGQGFVHAQGATHTEATLFTEPLPLETAGGLLLRVVHFVRRTGQSVVLSDARHDDTYGRDPYVAESQVRSVLCVPLQHHGRLFGCLYFEHRGVSGAFTEGRAKVAQMLSAQAAISLENARLFEEARSALAEVERLTQRLREENRYLREEISSTHNFEEILGHAPALRDALAMVERVAATDSTVLITGETGTGKELFARALHSRSPRASRPLVKVNCGAIPIGLAESELFGHVKGAFTGAMERRTGRFELADGGTLFLDEVGELPLDTQVKLLRVLQEGEFEAVGSSKTIKVDVRVLAATNRALEDAVTQGTFRSDLYYRLNVVPIRVPALRERIEDLSELVPSFIRRFAKRYGRPVLRVSEATLDLFRNYAWPGNVRELMSLVERGVVLSDGPVFSLPPDALPSALQATGRPASGRVVRTSLLPSEPPPSPRNQTLDEAQREHILSALSQTSGVIEGPRGAARLLDLHPNTLRSRMKRLGIAPDAWRAARIR